MKKLFVFVALAGSLLIQSCGGNSGDNSSSTEPAKDDAGATTSTASGESPSYDPERGKGKFTKVDIPDKIDPAMVKEGESVYNVKCASCHKMSGEKLVGPGWKGVTKRHKPEWIMNFITNTDEMLDKDPKAQAQLEICMVRMPNQNLSDDAARNLYEFMRQNDASK